MSGEPLLLLLFIQAAASLYLAGLIWFVQLVHYPLFAQVGPERFAGYEQRHRRLTVFAVLPPMVAELACAVLLVVWPAPVLPVAPVWLGAALVALLWALTFLIHVPQHVRLSAGFDPLVHRQLLRWNWARVAAWSGRGGLALALFALALKNPPSG